MRMISSPTLRISTLIFALIIMTGAESGSGAAVTHVIQISVDGFSAKHVQALVQGAPGTYPNLNRLLTEGAYTFNARCDYDYSETVPNHAGMFTGRPVLSAPGLPDTVHHGYFNNFPMSTHTFHNAGNPNVPYKSSAFDVAHDYGLRTAFYAGKTRLQICARSYDATNGAPDTVGSDNGRNKMDVVQINEGNTTLLLDALEAHFQTNASQYTFLHVVDPDTIGHSMGWGSSMWNSSISSVDDFVGRLLTTIASRPELDGHTAIILTGDHGGGGDGGMPPFRSHLNENSSTNYSVPFFVWGAGLTPGTDLYRHFSNRFDPGTSRPTINETQQPLRNGDAPNLALALLGLPPIPGSFFIPELTPFTISLQAVRNGSQLEIRWPSEPDGLRLEFADTLPPLEWQEIMDGISNNGTTRSLVVPLPGPDLMGWYRLRLATLSILRQPVSLSVLPGTNAIFSVLGAASAPLSYQWLFDGTMIQGAVGDSYTVTNVQAGDAGFYRVSISDGTDTLLSEAAELTVILGPVITAHPQSLNVLEGTNVTFSVSAAGTEPLSYQWQVDGMDIAGANQSTYSITNVQQAHEGDYRVVVTDPYDSATSQAAHLGILVVPMFVQSPQNQTVTAGETVVLTVTITGSPPPFGYRWRRNNVTLTNQVSNERTATFTIQNIQTSGNYSVIVTNAASYTPGVPSATGTITVMAPP